MVVASWQMMRPSPVSDTLRAALTRCRVIDLEHPRQIGDPTFPAHYPGMALFLSRRHELGGPERRTSASGVIVAAEHTGTHIDAISHQAEDLTLYGGIRVNPAIQGPHGMAAHGVETIPPILAPGQLLDVAALRGERLPERYLVTPTDLESCEKAQGISIGKGEVVMIRTGYGAVWDDPDVYLRAAGVSREAAEWLAARGVLAAGADNVAFDVTGHVDAVLACTLPSHVILLVRHGIYILENLALEELAGMGAHGFMVVCLPLKIKGGTGCPVRPVALIA